MVTPTPTAGPLIAAITGLGQSKIANVVRPPPSLIHSRFSLSSVLGDLGFSSLLNEASPAPKSAPAQNPLPEPVTIITLTSSSSPACLNAEINSSII